MSIRDFAFRKKEKNEEYNATDKLQIQQVVSSKNSTISSIAVVTPTPKEKVSNHNNHSISARQDWPQYGTPLSALFDNHNIQIIVEADIMCTQTFLAFAKTLHTYNQTSAIKQSVFVPDFEYSLVPMDIKTGVCAVLADSELVVMQSTTKDYGSLFLQQCVRRQILLLSKSVEKAQRVKGIALNARIKLRFYTLDNEGNLAGFNNFAESKQAIQVNTPTKEQFKVTTTITPTRVISNSLHTAIAKGSSVYDDNGNTVMLLQEYMSNATSITYKTNRPGILAKIYVPNVLKTSYFEDKTKLMLQKPINRNGIGWPLAILRNAQGGFVGSLVPQADGIPLMQSVLGEDQLKRYYPNWNKIDLCDLTICILEHIIYLQDRNVFFGCINPQSILVKDKSHVYFVDMDCYQIEGYSCTSQNITFQPPEFQMSGICKRLYTQQTENYEIAELVFMLLMPGKTPYAKEKNADMAQSIANMKFPFSWSGQPGNREVDRPSGRWRFVWSHLGHLKGDFYNTFMRDKAFNSPEKRKDARFWHYEVRRLRKDLEHPFDSESLELFPKTFKRDDKTQFFKCQYCGVEYPEFYFYRRYFKTPYRICNSCLNTRSNKSFECISSYHTAVDRKYYYSRKLEIFHELASERNPDWHKQKYCSECKHIRAQIYKELRCNNCGCIFNFNFGQKEDFDIRFGTGKWNLPKYCPDCQKNRKRY